MVRYSTVATRTDRRTASADGAEMMTRFAPPFKCAEAFSMVVKTPVDSQTVSAPACPHGMSVGSRREEERKVVKDKREEGESLKGSKILPMRTHDRTRFGRPDAQTTKLDPSSLPTHQPCDTTHTTLTSRVTFGKELDTRFTNDEASIVDRDFRFKHTVDTVVLQLVGGVVQRQKGIVDRHNVTVGVFEGGAKDETADASKSVDSKGDGHVGWLVGWLMKRESWLG
jgi:hypothetical protein